MFNKPKWHVLHANEYATTYTQIQIDKLIRMYVCTSVYAFNGGNANYLCSIIAATN